MKATDRFEIILEVKTNELGEVRYYPYVDETIRIFFGLIPWWIRHSIFHDYNNMTHYYTLISSVVSTSSFTKEDDAVRAANQAICREIERDGKRNIVKTETRVYPASDCKDK